jgi:PAS domain S-box-containing protein
MADISRILGRIFATAGRRPAPLRYGIALLLPLLALAFTFSIIDFTRTPFFSLFTLAVVVAATLGGTRPGLVATALSTAIAYVLVPPPFTWLVSDAEHLARILLFAIVGGLLSVLIGAAGRLQQKLDLERQRLEVTLRSIGDAVLATDTRGRITFMNTAAEKATGWKQAEAVGRKLPEVFRIINEQTRAIAENPVERVLRSGKTSGLANHTLLIRKDGSEIPIDDSAAPIMNKRVMSGVVLVFRDVTKARLSQAALLRTEKLASVGRLASTIAHEINNPLEAVGNLLYLIRVSREVAEARNFAATAERELARATHVLRQTLSLSRRSGSAEGVSLPEMVDGIAMLYMNRLQARGISLSTRYRGDGRALGVRHDLGQVVSNLLSNAIDAENPGGRIDIRITGGVPQKAVHLTVADRGSGMSREQLDLLYEPFFTTKESVGTGLGMWLTKEILNGSGGRIQVRSRLERGTVFRVTWPSALTELQEIPAADTEASG